MSLSGMLLMFVKSMLARLNEGSPGGLEAWEWTCAPCWAACAALWLLQKLA